MTTTDNFQRARRPEQKEERRLHLLATARLALQDGMEIHALGLNELARQAQMTKSNVYRYFENREELLLALLEEESAVWQAGLSRQLEGGPACTAAQLAGIFAGATAARPLLCRLLSVLPSIIEHNVSPERLTQFKLRTVKMMAAVAGLMQQSAPALSADACVAFLRQLMALVIGLWPLSHPGAALQQVLQQEPLQHLRYDFESDFAAALELLLRGMGIV